MAGKIFPPEFEVRCALKLPKFILRATGLLWFARFPPPPSTSLEYQLRGGYGDGRSVRMVPDRRAALWRLRALPLLLALSSVYLVLQNPYALGLLFLATLSLTAGVVGSMESLLGLVVFIIYIGGAMVLFSYCFMLTPLQEGDAPLPVHPLPLLVLLGLGGPPLLTSLYDFYWVLSLLLLVGLLLFVVIVSVVEVIDLGRGTIRVT